MNDVTTEEKIINGIEDILARLRTGQPHTVEGQMLTLKSKLPFKLLSVRELFIVRVFDLAESAWCLYKEGKRLSAIVLMRACLETCCLTYYTNKKSKHFLTNSDDREFDDVLNRILFGSKDIEKNPDPINILTVIDHVNKEYDGIRKMYDLLCEYAHPNYRGLLEAYGSTEDKFKLKVGSNLRDIPPAFGLAPFFMGLSIFVNEYNELESAVAKINSYFEDNST